MNRICRADISACRLARSSSPSPGRRFEPKIAGQPYSTHQGGPGPNSAHFYRNRQIELWASKPPTPLTLRQLVFYGRSMNEERLIKSANYVRTELPTRIAHRIRDMQALPYIVVTQEMVSKVYELYWDAFEKLRQYPAITTMEENARFCKFLQGLLNAHSPVIPYLALGLSLSSTHLTANELDDFFRRMLVSRISRRVIAEHHIALSDTMAGRHPDGPHGHVGLIYNELNLEATIGRCVDLLKRRPAGVADDVEDSDVMRNRMLRYEKDKWPKVIIDGHLDTRLSYIKEHLEYILFEILKNSMRFTIIKHLNSPERPVIRATIVSDDNDVHVRISDQGGGITPEINETTDLFSFSHLRNSMRLTTSRIGALLDASASENGVKGTISEQIEPPPESGTVEKAVNLRTRSGSYKLASRIGLGLPMSNIIATYFGETY
ncbi:hypothetical protein FRC02_012033 [Tulasnella sp. 418]|nr:hypothetical protein FRC02_012033 [Tulasnella sp. 418]